MATSGTVARTTISTANLIEHAIRRCGLSPASITAETLSTAREALYLLLLGLANRGLNLWCVETNYIGLKENQALVQMPVGTIDILNVLFSRPSPVTGANVQAGSNYTTTLDASTPVIRIGVKFNTIAASETVTISSSDDDITYATLVSEVRTDWISGAWYWFAIDPVARAQYFRVSTIAAIDVAEFYLASTLFDIPIYPLNRDDYMALPNKQIASAFSYNYYYERKLNPQISLWPIPSDEHNHLTIVRHRQVMDVGAVTGEIEIPNRWFEAIIWQLAERLCFEVPGVDPQRVQMVMAASMKNLAEAEMEEVDGTTIRMNVRIGGYTK